MPLFWFWFFPEGRELSSLLNMTVSALGLSPVNARDSCFGVACRGALWCVLEPSEASWKLSRSLPGRANGPGCFHIEAFIIRLVWLPDTWGSIMKSMYPHHGAAYGNRYVDIMQWCCCVKVGAGSLLRAASLSCLLQVLENPVCEGVVSGGTGSRRGTAAAATSTAYCRDPQADHTGLSLFRMDSSFASCCCVCVSASSV